MAYTSDGFNFGYAYDRYLQIFVLKNIFSGHKTTDHRCSSLENIIVKTMEIYGNSLCQWNLSSASVLL